MPDHRRDHPELAIIGYLRIELREQRREIQRLRVENEAWVRRRSRRFVEIYATHPAFGAERVTPELKRQGIEVAAASPGWCA